MINYKNGKWAREIILLQKKDGSWGDEFHSMAVPNKKRPITTEQALRRLKILGFTIEDEVIQRSVRYMRDCLLRKQRLPKRDLNALNNVYNDMILATWICQFTDMEESANRIAAVWSGIITSACQEGIFCEQQYQKEYDRTFGKIEKESLSIAFHKFYPVALVANHLDERSESVYFDKILSYEKGIYYLGSGRPLNQLPNCFESKEASRYLGAIEVMAQYKSDQCWSKLQFVADWLYKHQSADETWDMGAAAKDSLYFPLSDGWRKEERRKDCTYRIQKIVHKIMG